MINFSKKKVLVTDNPIPVPVTPNLKIVIPFFAYPAKFAYGSQAQDVTKVPAHNDRII